MIILSAKTKRNLNRILPFAIIWLVTGVVFLITELIASNNQEFIASSAIKIDTTIFLFALLSLTLLGLFVGFMELLFIKSLFNKKPFSLKILYKLLLYCLLLSSIIFILYSIAASIEMNVSIFHKSVWYKYVDFFFSSTHIGTIVQIGYSLFLSLLYAEISENLGQNVLFNFFTGKYHKPILENRIFMFTDMKNSTAIAEKLGSVKYFEFLKTYYNDLSDAIIDNYGEVYQYIGDEIVISWKVNNKDSYTQSITCFFAMKNVLLKKKNWYIKEYGIFPTFKGAIHSGEITAGEIGAIKKEIFFTGDVINTTARVQALCSKFNIELLATNKIKEVLDALEYDFNLINKESLKGKSNLTSIYEIKIKD
jgi:adenylate cyclase